MSGRRLNGQNDIWMENGRVARLGNREERVAQSVQTMLKTFEGEAFTDRGHGFPWYGAVLERNVLDLQYARTLLNEKILQVPGVAEVLSLEIDHVSGRRLAGSFRVRTLTGVEVGGEL
jgi:hypothetical protein